MFLSGELAAYIKTQYWDNKIAAIWNGNMRMILEAVPLNAFSSVFHSNIDYFSYIFCCQILVAGLLLPKLWLCELTVNVQEREANESECFLNVSSKDGLHGCTNFHSWTNAIFKHWNCRYLVHIQHNWIFSQRGIGANCKSLKSNRDSSVVEVFYWDILQFRCCYLCTHNDSYHSFVCCVVSFIQPIKKYVIWSMYKYCLLHHQSRWVFAFQ